MDRWQNKVAVVTGASFGIGAAIFTSLVKAGLVVIGLARHIEKFEEVKKSLTPEEQKRAFFEYCDVSRKDIVAEVFENICKTHGGVDVLINNAACTKDGWLADMDIDDVQSAINTNIMGVVYCTQAAIKSMREREFSGHIINMNSVLGHQVLRMAGIDTVGNIYPTTKFAVTAMTETLRHELIMLGTRIKVTSISPGVVDTEMAHDKTKLLLKNKLLYPKDIADTILFVLATPPHVQIHELLMRGI